MGLERRRLPSTGFYHARMAIFSSHGSESLWTLASIVPASKSAFVAYFWCYQTGISISDFEKPPPASFNECMFEGMRELGSSRYSLHVVRDFAANGILKRVFQYNRKRFLARRTMGFAIGSAATGFRARSGDTTVTKDRR